MEKSAEAEPVPPYDTEAKAVDVKELRFGEAADVFGDAEKADKYGYVSRGYVFPIAEGRGKERSLTRLTPRK